jgi:hypothetical protein
VPAPSLVFILAAAFQWGCHWRKRHTASTSNARTRPRDARAPPNRPSQTEYRKRSRILPVEIKTARTFVRAAHQFLRWSFRITSSMIS